MTARVPVTARVTVPARVIELGLTELIMTGENLPFDESPMPLPETYMPGVNPTVLVSPVTWLDPAVKLPLLEKSS